MRLEIKLLIFKMIKLSRSKIELFLECPRCFWLDIHGIAKRPPGFPFTINNAIDYLLKKEFDEYRENDLEHHLIKKYNIDAKPYNCDELDKWRHNFTGIQFNHKESGFLVFGAVDDIWINKKGELIVVDYKATGAKEHKIYDSYKRQMEVYQWLLSNNGYKVSKTGYFLFAKFNKEKGFGEGKLKFDLMLEVLEGDSSWVGEVIMEAKKCYDNAIIPAYSEDCDYCKFIKLGSK